MQVRSLLLCLALLLVGASLTSALNNTLIYQDTTSGLKFVIYDGLVNAGDADATFDTLHNTYTLANGSVYTFTPPIRIALDWANDTTDVYSFAIAQNLPVSVTAVGPNAVQCAYMPGTSITVNAGNEQCNYEISWTAPFSGVISLTYNTGSGVNPDSAQQVSIPFVGMSIIGDPQFVGLRGQSYQVHGLDGAVYNIVSEQNTQVNARFVFLTEGACPMFNGVADTNCWSHPGSYLGELSFQQAVNGKLHAALVTAGSAKTGFSMVQMDGKQVRVGQTVSFGSFSLTLTSTHAVVITTEHFSFELSNSDMFVNQAVRATVPLAQLQSHGLLGQTHNAQLYSSTLRYIDGEVDDYVIADNDIFGSDFVFNKFQL
jgi:hypothetical protein